MNETAQSCAAASHTLDGLGLWPPNRRTQRQPDLILLLIALRNLVSLSAASYLAPSLQTPPCWRGSYRGIRASTRQRPMLVRHSNSAKKMMVCSALLPDAGVVWSPIQTFPPLSHWGRPQPGLGGLPLRARLSVQVAALSQPCNAASDKSNTRCPASSRPSPHSACLWPTVPPRQPAFATAQAISAGIPIIPAVRRPTLRL